jgi:hypothetical protein
MDTSAKSFPLVKREWRRLLSRLRRVGAQKTCDHVLESISSAPYPLAITTRLIRYLLRRGDYRNAGRLIIAIRRTGESNPLLDKVQIWWLWKIGKRRAALSLGLKSSTYWERSYLFSLVGDLYKLLNKGNNSPYYRRKSISYQKLALLAQDREASAWANAAEIKKARG